MQSNQKRDAVVAKIDEWLSRGCVGSITINFAPGRGIDTIVVNETLKLQQGESTTHMVETSIVVSRST